MIENPRGTKRTFAVPAIFFGLYLFNVCLAKAQVLMGNNSPVHIGDVGEFLLLFATSFSFVVATLMAESRAADEQPKKI